MSKVFCAAIIMISVFSMGFTGNTLSGKIREGNKLYENKDYDAALVKYNDAQADDPARAEIFFNMGNVFYRQKKYEEAIDAFKKSMEKGDQGLAGKALYNTGNALFQQGRLKEALETYKQALERDPDDVDTKYNIEYTERKIKEMLSRCRQTKQEAEKDQSRKEQSEQQEKQGQEAGEGAKKEGEGQSGDPARGARREDNEKEKQAGAQGRAGMDNRDEENKTGDEKSIAEEKGSAGDKQDEMSGAEEKAEGQGESREGEKKGTGRSREGRPGEKKELNKEEAERFLSSFDQDQKNLVPPDNQKEGRGREPYVEKDW
ncbi:MAG: tetratricopeptide repeat protein [Candidatus Omnitrophota bacterium]